MLENLVIASEAKQSRGGFAQLGIAASLSAPRNDGLLGSS
jgi:hypothetical protein